MKHIAAALFTLGILFLCKSPAQAWDCPLYRTGISESSSSIDVWAENASALDEATQLLELWLDGVKVGDGYAPDLPAHSARVTVFSVPAQDWRTAEVRAESDCGWRGTRGDPPPPPPPNVFVCHTGDKGDLWGKVEVFNTDEAGNILSVYDGWALITNDARLALWANPNQPRSGYILVRDEFGHEERFWVAPDAQVDCGAMGCQRLYRLAAVKEPCACEEGT